MSLNHDGVINFLLKHAPSMSVKEAVWLANEIDNMNKESYYDACCLSVLSSKLLEPKGSIPDAIKSERPAIQLAYKNLSYRHAWTVCGPVTDGMERLLEEWDKKALGECGR